MNMNMNADLRPGIGGAVAGTELPLTPTEAEMFRVLCVCPEEEEEEEESPDCEMGPTDLLRKHDADVDVDIDINVDGEGDVDVEVVEEETEPEPRSLKDGRSLRRSKRVADAAARTHTMRRTRGPKHA